MDTKELALTPSMTLDFLPIRPIPSPSDDDMTLNQDINADRRVKRQKEAIGNENSVAGWHAFYTAPPAPRHPSVELPPRCPARRKGGLTRTGKGSICAFRTPSEPENDSKVDM
jgi:hypothetical protein